MKTLVFCTSYVESAPIWELRYRVWTRSLLNSSLDFDQLLIVDDASSVLPDWDDLAIFKQNDFQNPEGVRSTSKVLLYQHSDRLGRQSVFEFPGWYRSFVFGVRYGLANGFDKIIHIESDAHLLSDRIKKYFNEVTDAWVGLWCEKYGMPEIAIQVAAGGGLKLLSAFVDRPYGEISGQNHELQFPFTHVEKGFKGDRYGEDLESRVPRNADYSSQTLIGKDEAFYWWLAGPQQSEPYESCAPFDECALGVGWASPDSGFVWMEGFESALTIPGIDISEFDTLELGLSPCIFEERKLQRLFVLVNEVYLREISIVADMVVTCEVSNVPSRVDSVVRFIHPDAFAPCKVGNHPESRQLSVALSFVRLGRKSGQDQNPVTVPASRLN